MIKSFDYNSPQTIASVSGGTIKPFTYPEPKNYTVSGVEHGPAVVDKLRTQANTAQAEADKGVTLKDFGEGFMSLPGPSDVKDVIGGAVQGVKDVIAQSPEKNISNIGTPALDRGSQVLRDTISNSGDRLAKAVSTAFDTHASLLEKGVSAGEAGMGLLNALFTPITVSLATVEGIPGVGHLAEGVSALFSAISNGVGVATGNVIERLPVSNKTKETVTPLAKEIMQLAAQIFVGGKAAKGIDTTQGVFRIANTAVQVMDLIKNDQFVKPTLEAAKTSKIEPFDYSKLPLVDSTGKQDLRTVMINLERGGYSKGQVGAIMGKVIENNNTGRFTPKEISDVASEMLPDNPQKSTAIIKDNPNFQGRQSTIPTTEASKLPQEASTEQSVGTSLEQPSTGIPSPFTPTEMRPTEQSGSFSSMVFARMKNEHPELQGEATYNPIKLQEDAQRAVSLIESDKQKAYRVAMGAEKSMDVTQTAVSIALSEKALRDGNTTLASTLIRKRSLDQTRRGQEIVSERGSITDNSTSKYIKELLATRLDILGNEYLSDIKTKIRGTSLKSKAMEKLDGEVAKATKSIKGKELDIKAAQSLLDNLVCT